MPLQQLDQVRDDGVCCVRILNAFTVYFFRSPQWELLVWSFYKTKLVLLNEFLNTF